MNIFHSTEGAHDGCPDPYCCPCECIPCRRAWVDVGKKTFIDCPDHGSLTGEAYLDHLVAVYPGGWAERMLAAFARDAGGMPIVVSAPEGRATSLKIDEPPRKRANGMPLEHHFEDPLFESIRARNPNAPPRFSGADVLAVGTRCLPRILAADRAEETLGMRAALAPTTLRDAIAQAIKDFQQRVPATIDETIAALAAVQTTVHMSRHQMGRAGCR